MGNDPGQDLAGLEVDAYPVALAPPSGAQAPGEPVGLRLPLCEGDPVPAVHVAVRHLVRVRVGHQPELVSEQACHQPTSFSTRAAAFPTKSSSASAGSDG